MDVQAELARHSVKRTSGLLDGDRRRYRRVHLTLAGRFMRANHDEFTCTLRDVSVGGAAVTTTATPDVGERVVAYFEHLGGLDGTVARILPDGFTFQFKVSEHKREKLAAQLTWLLNRDAFPAEAGRLHERVGTKGRKTTLRLEEGIILDVDLLDISASGASVGTSARPAIGEAVTLGRLPAIVRRHHTQGFGVQFVAVLPADALSTHFP